MADMFPTEGYFHWQNYYIWMTVMAEIGQKKKKLFTVKKQQNTHTLFKNENYKIKPSPVFLTNTNNYVILSLEFLT